MSDADRVRGALGWGGSGSALPERHRILLLESIADFVLAMCDDAHRFPNGEANLARLAARCAAIEVRSLELRMEKE